MKYVVVGGLTIDHVVSTRGERMPSQFGGNAAYGSAGLRLWAKPGEVGIVARMGEDYPREWVDKIRQAGIDTEGVRSLPIPHTLRGGMVYNSRGDRDDYVNFSEDGKAFAAQDPERIRQAQEDFAPDSGDIPESYRSAEGIFLAPRKLEKQLDCARFFRQAGEGKKIIVDPLSFSMRMERKAELESLLSMVDAFLPSEVEVTELFGPIDPKEAARRLGEMGAPVVVIKLGREGCLVYERQTGEMTRLPVCRVDARDPTGAGDSFCGGYLAGLLLTGDPVLAAVYGTVTSSFIISGFGVEYTYPVSSREAQSRLQDFMKQCAQEVPGVRAKLERYHGNLPAQG